MYKTVQFTHYSCANEKGLTSASSNSMKANPLCFSEKNKVKVFFTSPFLFTTRTQEYVVSVCNLSYCFVNFHVCVLHICICAPPPPPLPPFPHLFHVIYCKRPGLLDWASVFIIIIIITHLSKIWLHIHDALRMLLLFVPTASLAWWEWQTGDDQFPLSLVKSYQWLYRKSKCSSDPYLLYLKDFFAVFALT